MASNCPDAGYIHIIHKEKEQCCGKTREVHGGQASKENWKGKLLKRPVCPPRLGTVGTIQAVSSLL